MVSKDKRNPGYIGVLIAELDEQVEWRKRDDGRWFRHAYFRRTNTHITHYQAVWVELDEGTPEEQVERIRSFQVEPTMIVHSGGRSYHAYWVLSEPICKERFNRVMKRLCAVLKGDPRATDARRQLRIPGSLYEKSLDDGHLKRARLVFDQEFFPSIEAIEALLPAFEDASGKPTNRKRTVRKSHLVLPDLSVLPDTELLIAETHKQFGSMRDGQRNSLVLDLIRYFHEKGFVEAQTATIVNAYSQRYPGTSKDLASNPADVAREIEAATVNWYGKACYVAPEPVRYATVAELRKWLNDVLNGLPTEWPESDKEAFTRWLNAFIQYLTTIAHNRGIRRFRSHALSSRQLERLPAIGRNGRSIAYRGKRHLIERGVLVVVHEPSARLGLATAYDIQIPIVAPKYAFSSIWCQGTSPNKNTQ